MDDTFLTRIPSLSDEELLDYLHHPASYKLEAVKAAMAEWVRRGHRVEDVDLVRIKDVLALRDAPGRAPRGPGFLHDGTSPRFRRIRLIAGGIVAAGMGAAAVIYRLADTAAPALGELEPTDSKKYLRDVEVIGGKANVLATDLRHGFNALWQGRGLAFTVMGLAMLLALGFWLGAAHGNPGLTAGSGSSNK